MKRARPFVQRLVRDRRAATAIEYGLIAALIVIAMIGGLQLAATAISSMWNNTSDKVQNAR